MKTKLILILLCFFHLIGQSQPRGGFSFADVGAYALSNTSPMSNGRYSQLTCSSVGGISYDQVAKPEANFQISGLDIHYVGTNPDGQRLSLSINGKMVNTSFFDWQLIPTANYANSQVTSCFTYFGKLENQYIEKVVIENGGHIMNYHPSFENTLLGFRLMDMDLLYMYDFVSDLPKLNNAYILGNGENIPDVNANIEGLNNFYREIANIEGALNQHIRSYIISDFKRPVTISIKNDSLQLSEFPYYFCWQYKWENPTFDSEAVRDGIVKSYEDKKAAELKKNPAFNVKSFVIDSLISKAVAYKLYFDLYSGGTFIDLVNLPDDRTIRVNFLMQYSLSSLDNMLKTIAYDMEAWSIDYLEEFSNRMSNVDLLKKTNPAVWNANVNTMRYAAFFRYVKLNFPNQWNLFVQELDNIVPQPVAETYTVMYDTGNSLIIKALDTYPIAVESSLEVYPNPFSDYLVINSSSEMESIAVFGMDGKLILQYRDCPSPYQFNTAFLNKGLYVLVVKEKLKPAKSFKMIK
jgi:hypothetical protein